MKRVIPIRSEAYAQLPIRRMTDILTSSPIRPTAKLFLFPASDARLDSEFVYKTVPLGITPHLQRKPLRLIIARTPVTREVQPGYFLTHFLDTLVCGHQTVTYSFEAAKRRRGCQECLDALAASIPRKEAA